MIKPPYQVPGEVILQAYGTNMKPQAVRRSMSLIRLSQLNLYAILIDEMRTFDQAPIPALYESANVHKVFTPPPSEINGHTRGEIIHAWNQLLTLPSDARNFPSLKWSSTNSENFFEKTDASLKAVWSWIPAEDDFMPDRGAELLIPATASVDAVSAKSLEWRQWAAARGRPSIKAMEF